MDRIGRIRKYYDDHNISYNQSVDVPDELVHQWEAEEAKERKLEEAKKKKVIKRPRRKS